MKKIGLALGLFLFGNEIISLLLLCVLGAFGVFKLFDAMARGGGY